MKHTHTEKHFHSARLLRDAVLGMSDGLTVPFALTAGLSGAAVAGRIVVTAGLAEIAAGCIAMGLGGYLAARSDREHYRAEHSREMRETHEQPEEEEREVSDIFKTYGLTDAEIEPVLKVFRAKPPLWVDFMMRFELGLERPERHEDRNSAFTIAVSYALGGLVPLCPYFFLPVPEALPVSMMMTLTALFVFGWVKGKFLESGAFKTALQTSVIGALAAAAAFGIASLIQ